MAESQLPISFDGLGPIPSPKPSFAQGIGRDGSFAPIWTTDPKMPAQFRGAGSSAFTNPFDIKFTSSTSFLLNPGIIAGYLPDNIFNPISYSSGDLYVWATCTASSGVITGVTLNSGGSTPIPQTINAGFPPSSLNIPLGMVNGGVGNTFNFIGANWLTPYPVISYTTADGTNYYIWRW